jgi:hypothetical protein
MNPRFSYHHLPNLPSNAWSVFFWKNVDAVQVFHGSGVEVRDGFFAEAVWNDSFDAAGLGNASLFFGTGCHIDGTHAVFHTSSDNTAPIYSLRRKDEVMLSNSIIHLMELSGTAPLNAYPFYTYDLLRTARAGIGQPSGTLFHRGGGVLKVHFKTRIRADCSLEMSCSPYSAVPKPIDYANLLAIYRTEIGRLFENGAHEGRTFQYGQSVLCSSGYDSLANSVVCAGLGSRTFISVVDSRSESPVADSGKGPLGWIGLDVHEADRYVHLSSPKACDAEFALGALSNYPFLSACEGYLGKSLLINGNLGDVMWSGHNGRLSGNDGRDWGLYIIPCLSSTEHRLRVGYIDVSPQAMFIQQADAVFRISASKEMEPYLVDPAYDRPIPRRIIEESGVPRGTFATRKMATGFTHFSNPISMHPDALDAYRSFVDRSIPKGPLRWFSKGLHAIEQFLHKHWFRSHPQWRNDDPDRFRLVAVDGFRLKVPWQQSYLLQWSFEVLRGRYAAAAVLKRNLSH